MLLDWAIGGFRVSGFGFRDERADASPCIDSDGGTLPVSWSTRVSLRSSRCPASRIQDHQSLPPGDTLPGKPHPTSRISHPASHIPHLASHISYPVSPIPSNARILIFRMGHLGDILHLMPTVREMRRQRPGWKLELVTGPWSKALAESFGLFDAIHEYCPDVVQYHRGNRHSVRSAAEEKAFIIGIRGSGVDLVFCPNAPHFCELPLVVGLGAERYVGAPWPMDEVPPPLESATKPFNSRQYEMDAVADFLPMMGLERPGVKLAYPLTAPAREKARDWVKEHVPDGRLVLIFPGSGWPGKNWPPDSFARLADELIQKEGVSIGLCGSPAEVPLCKQISHWMEADAHILAGQFALDEMAALMRHSLCVIGNDSAPIHIAAALDIPTVSLWGPTFPEKWAPRGSAHQQVMVVDCCEGCLYWHVKASCRRDSGCMASVRDEDVLHAAQHVLKTLT